MEEFESQTEGVEEHLHEHAHHASEKWISGVALTAALLAALAATTALLAGDHVNEAMMDRIKAASDWSYYQSVSIKSAQVQSRIDNAEVNDRPAKAEDREKLAKYERQHKEIYERATEEGESSDRHFHRHEVLAKGVTMFQVAIAVSAIAALTRRRAFWFVGIALGCVGVYFLVRGLMPAPTSPPPSHVAPADAVRVISVVPS